MDCSGVATQLTATQRHAYSPTPPDGFFDAFQTAFEQFAQPDAAGSSVASEGDPAADSLADVLGATQTEMADLRGVGEEDQLAYAKILYEAYSGDGMSDPQSFLQSLSASELDVVRRIRCLADTIQPQALDDEGATNLLLPEGYSVDLNHDGIDEVGAAKLLHFPPRDAPPAFTDAWFEATKDCSFGDYATHSMAFLVAFHPPAATDNAASALPANQLESYRTIVDNYLSMLDSFRGMLPEGQYERDQPFFSRLQKLLKNA
jgi:hypothetical protein